MSETETETTSAIFHFAYIVKLIAQGQVYPSVATAECNGGNAWSFFPVGSQEILPPKQLASPRRVERKKKTNKQTKQNKTKQNKKTQPRTMTAPSRCEDVE